MTSRKQLSQRKFDLTTPALRDNVLHFYADLSAPIETKKRQGWPAKGACFTRSVEVSTPVPTLAADGSVK